jgi:hypothetical protein
MFGTLRGRILGCAPLALLARRQFGLVLIVNLLILGDVLLPRLAAFPASAMVVGNPASCSLDIS